MGYKKDDHVRSLTINTDDDGSPGSELIAGVAGKRICVLGLVLFGTDVTSLWLYSGTPNDGGTMILGKMGFNTDTKKMELPISPSPRAPWCSTIAGELLNLRLSSATSHITGTLVYIIQK